MKAGASSVWASCCGLLNEVMGTGAVRGQQPGFGGGAGPFRFASNMDFSPYPTSTNIVCKACGLAFSVFRKKHVCCECKKDFCSVCSTLQENLRRCATCLLLQETAFQRPQLMKLKVKDLRLYLTLRNIPTDGCREKEDLVELVLCHHGTCPEEEMEGTSETISVTSDTEPQEQQVTELSRKRARASLSDLSTLEEIEGLTIRQLKEILARNFVNYSGCCEKWELVEKVNRLYRENEENRKSLENLESKPEPDKERLQLMSNEDNLCRICMDAVIDCVLLECGHMVTCTKCGKRMSECPICRQYVVRAVHVFKS
ncbi:E3 ubiquitin-protein ligase RNF34 isoform X3 [Ascaphus truei]|uniref:E3 ubiquitin-protein ligase RNF34 isoform X3 n=1 Tax=Ascaphus truei TaxID=8439 RepID=UPI003F5A5CB5